MAADRVKLKRAGRLSLKFLTMVFESLFSMLLVLIFSKRAKIAQKEAGKGLVVLGNGPSLKSDMDCILRSYKGQDFDYLCVNGFAVSEWFEVVKPQAYVISDSNYWREDVSEEVIALRNDLIHALTEKVVWPMSFYMPMDAKGTQFEQLVRSDWVRIVFYNRTPISGLRWLTYWFFDKSLGMPAPHNVLISALSLGIQLKYKKILLAGADHSWHEELRVCGRNETSVRQLHFYDKGTRLLPVYKNKTERFTVSELFITWGEAFKCYETLADYGRSRGVEIVNIGSKTYIDAFPIRPCRN